MLAQAGAPQGIRAYGTRLEEQRTEPSAVTGVRYFDRQALASPHPGVSLTTVAAP